MTQPQTINDLKEAVALFTAISNRAWVKDFISGEIVLTPEMRRCASELSKKYLLDIVFIANQGQRYSLEQIPVTLNELRIEFEPFYLSIYRNWEEYLSRRDNQINFKAPFYLDNEKDYVYRESENRSPITNKYFALLETIDFLRRVSCLSKERECIFYYHKQNMKFNFAYSFKEIADLEISDKLDKFKSILLPKEIVPLYEDKIRIFRHLLWEKCFRIDTKQNNLIFFYSTIDAFFQDFEIECELVFDKFSLDTILDKVDVEVRNLQKRINDNLSSIQGKLFSIPIASAVAIGQFSRDSLWKNLAIFILATLALLIICLAIKLQKQNLSLISEELEDLKRGLSPVLQKKFVPLLKRVSRKITTHCILIYFFYALLLFSLLVTSVFFAFFTNSDLGIMDYWKIKLLAIGNLFYC